MARLFDKSHWTTSDQTFQKSEGGLSPKDMEELILLAHTSNAPKKPGAIVQRLHATPLGKKVQTLKSKNLQVTPTHLSKCL
jgi:hypothetical protein